MQPGFCLNFHKTDDKITKNHLSSILFQSPFLSYWTFAFNTVDHCLGNSLFLLLIWHLYSDFSTLLILFADCYFCLVLMLGAFSTILPFWYLLISFTSHPKQCHISSAFTSFKTLSFESITLVQTSLPYCYSFNNFLFSIFCVPGTVQTIFPAPLKFKF